MRRRSKPSGFTLVELLVVMAIIAVLASLLLPSLARAKSQGYSTKCLSNLHQIGLTMTLYTGDYGAYPLYVTGTNGVRIDSTWIHDLNRYLREPPLRWSDNYFHPPFGGVWLCPSVRPAQPRSSGLSAFYTKVRASYGYNGYGLRDSLIERPLLGIGGHMEHPFVPSVDPVRESEVSSPGEMIAAGDGVMGYSEAYQPSDLLCRKAGAGEPAFLEPYQKEIRTRHRGKLNVLSCDAHVASFKLDALFKQRSDAALSRWNRDNQPHADILQGW